MSGSSVAYQISSLHTNHDRYPKDSIAMSQLESNTKMPPSPEPTIQFFGFHLEKSLEVEVSYICSWPICTQEPHKDMLKHMHDRVSFSYKSDRARSILLDTAIWLFLLCHCYLCSCPVFLLQLSVQQQQLMNTSTHSVAVGSLKPKASCSGHRGMHPY